MIFSSIFFIFVFFPLVFFLFSMASQRYKFLVLLFASFLFYFWGEQSFIIVILGSILINYSFGLVIESSKNKKFFLSIGIIINLALIFYFKYALFFLSNLSNSSFENIDIHLPLGISFFTFQGISYLFDIYRGEIFADRSFLRFSFYISFFPQLIAGPIVRYSDVFHSLTRLKSNHKEILDGLCLFAQGLGKKVIIANTLGIYADEVFSTDFSLFGSGVAWFAILSYSFQIYFDFSGYSDMAIGLGRIFGLKFPVNFNFPYSALSIQDFWRRWHISLSTWFRDYLYIPLGGNRIGKTRQFFNLILVFFCCGFWHGASWNFLIWGIYHGFFLVLERTGYQRILLMLPMFSKFLLNFALINIGWVFFRTETLADSISFIKVLFGENGIGIPQMISTFDFRWLLGMLISLVFAFEWRIFNIVANNVYLSRAFSVGVFMVSIFFLVANNYNPFIYFRF
ncbi:MBOAT family protein [Leptospira mtsangambouensis]|uniref:MBOAT family protein n=1 Tax=Leptospira mtsangambouensis TaxID=2484912 RepID=A0ABY2P572_9LEPT|nr:MBOAT family protein [Leptospira mtsangambouensis]